MNPCNPFNDIFSSNQQRILTSLGQRTMNQPDREEIVKIGKQIEGLLKSNVTPFNPGTIHTLINECLKYQVTDPLSVVRVVQAVNCAHTPEQAKRLIVEAILNQFYTTGLSRQFPKLMIETEARLVAEFIRDKEFDVIRKEDVYLALDEWVQVTKVANLVNGINVKYNLRLSPDNTKMLNDLVINEWDTLEFTAKRHERPLAEIVEDHFRFLAALPGHEFLSRLLPTPQVDLKQVKEIITCMETDLAKLKQLVGLW